MIQFQANDETGYIEIETEGAVFFRTREGVERYLEWDNLTEDLQEVLQRFVEDTETAFDEAMDTLQNISVDGSVDVDQED